MSSALLSASVSPLAMHPLLPYDPGVLPSAPSPSVGDTLTFVVDGLPPYKEIRRSLRNPSHPNYPAFVLLRAAAIEAMYGRAWYFGAVKLDIHISGPRPASGPSLNEYIGGVMDTLDGSAGVTFTYLPVVFQDDCQVCDSRVSWTDGDCAYSYEVFVKFL